MSTSNNNTNSNSSSNSNLFQDVLTDAQGVQNKLLGPSYPYYNNIKTPTELGMSSDGTLSALGNDINGLINYVSLLVEGNSKASKTGQPLGNKFFLKTGAKCLDTSSNQQVDRYIYIDNVPNGSIPFISSGLGGVNFTNFRGLIPGSMQDLNALNPFTIMQAFLSGSTPPCQQITMEVVDTNNNSSSETQYVTLVDIQNMNPCTFKNGTNPITGKSCRQAFQTLEMNNIPQLPSDPIAQLYFLGLSGIGIYILYKLMEKS